VAVSARDRKKNRDADLSGYAWEDDPVALARATMWMSSSR
jgi:homoserine dehydrogenase